MLTLAVPDTLAVLDALASTRPFALPLALGLAVVGAALGPALAQISLPLHLRWPTPQQMLSGWWPLSRRACAMGLACGLLWFGAALRWGTHSGMVPLLFVLAVLVVMSAVDLEHQLIPDRLTVPAIFVALPALVIAAGVAGEPRRVLWTAIGAFGYSAPLFAAFLIYPDGMGFGDVKLAPLLGAFLGWSAVGPLDAVQRVVGAVFVASLLGSLIGVGVWIRHGRERHYPFGPWLAAGTVAVLLASPPT